MDIFNTKNLVIRNLKPNDFLVMSKLYELNEADKNSVSDLKESIEKAKSDDFNSEGVKRFAIDKSGFMIGELALAFDKPYISFDYKLYEKEDTRINAQEMLIALIPLLHKLYPYREINISVPKFDYKKRSILENLSFNRKSYNAEDNMYMYSLFIINPNK